MFPIREAASKCVSGLLKGILLASCSAAVLCGQTDPGARTVSTPIGGPISGITANERRFFDAGLDAFSEVASVRGTLANTESGLGPRFNLDSCAGCHAHPAVGGSSPPVNPQIAVATKAGATNTIPSFLSLDGPIREVRFQRDSRGRPDGSVHSLFTIKGRLDAPGCNIAQPDFAGAVADRNVIFRIPTPLFGSGLIEAIPDSAILANKASNSFRKGQLGISGRENRNGNDGTITRFGWKAQNKSLLIFSGEAYNVEQGVTSELFPDERDQTPGCLFNQTPEDHTDVNETVPEASQGDVVLFALFMKFLAPPSPAPATTSINNGRSLFDRIGCTLCHTPTLTTGNHSSAALRNKPVNLYSDLLLHDMGTGLADGVSQGDATGREFRTAPLWGLGQRLFFLHDGRSRNLIDAIQQHASQGSEASDVVSQFNSLSQSQKQDLLNFLRSL